MKLICVIGNTFLSVRMQKNIQPQSLTFNYFTKA